MTKLRRPPSPTSSGTLLSERPAAGPPLDGAIRFLEGAGARGTPRASGRRGARAHPRRDEAGGDPSSSARAWNGSGPSWRPHSAHSACRMRSKAGSGSARRRSARPCSLCCASSGSPGAPRLVRLPALTVLRSRPGACGLPRRTPSRPRRERPDQSRRGDTCCGAAAADARHLRAAVEPLEAVRGLARSMIRAAHGLEGRRSARTALDLRAHRAVTDLVAELEEWLGLGARSPASELFGALERATLRIARGDEPGRVAVTDLLRARTAHRDRLPARSRGGEPASPAGHAFPRRGGKALDRRGFQERAARSQTRSRASATSSTPPAPGLRAACTSSERPRRTTAHRGSRARSGTRHKPSSIPTTSRWTTRRRLAQLTWDVDSAPTERERLRALSPLAAENTDEAVALAHANGWDRRLARALGAFSRPTRLTDQALVDSLREKTSFSVTELELFADCSSIWFLERLIDPRSIDGEVDARLRGSIAHQTLFKFFSGLPKELGIERVDADRLDDALAFLRTCLAEAIDSGVWIELGDLQRRAGRGALARSRELRARGGRVAARARPAPVRGRLRLRPVGARAPERPPGRRLLAGREDRPHRPRSLQRARDRPGLQVGEDCALGREDRV